MISREISRMYVRLEANMKHFEKGFARATSIARRFAKESAQVMARVGTAGATAGAALGGYAIKLAADAEKVQVAFETMLGSKSAAEQLGKQLEAFAASTPFQLPEIQMAAKKLLAFGYSVNEVDGALRNMGDIAAGVDMPMSELADIMGKARVQGRLFQEDINQLTGRGIPIIGALASQFGVAESELRGLVEKGQVEFKHLQAAMQSLTAEGGRFTGLMAKQSETLAGKFSTLKDNANASLREIGKVLIESFDLKGVTQRLTDFIQTYQTVFVEKVKEGAKLVSFVFQNWSSLISLQVNKGLLAVASFAADVGYFFTDVIPAYVRIMPKAFAEAFRVIIENGKRFYQAINAAMKGQGWTFVAEGMSDAFLKEMKKLPELADRPMTEFERHQTKFIEGLEEKLGKSWAKIFEAPKVNAEAGVQVQWYDNIKSKMAEWMRVAQGLMPKMQVATDTTQTFRVNQAVRGDTMEALEGREFTEKFLADQTKPDKDKEKVQTDQLKEMKHMNEKLQVLVKGANPLNGIRVLGSAIGLG